MLKAIDENGGSFTILDFTYANGSYVCKVRMKNGKEYFNSGPNYFEISNKEYYCFEEIEEPDTGITKGVISLKLEVDKTNFNEMIELIKNSFS
ncbi:hypothetical protein AVV36_gp186 [Pectobacterium bacteriophage PM2]|uniref:Uncharacterized protein n=1 Tax=Pectobacterium bacteriophage PM2 TaxID=1429794 RepID=A0A0A0PZQ1_9CAUD|nr:hypothetical protein AVV36_gp186 [Pectobacterium bacteriophage PM2]AHY25224.1 hypothetical protein PM2_262 [Pectobacterium bacteriophage PM2]